MLTEGKVSLLERLTNVWAKFLKVTSKVSWFSILKLVVFASLIMTMVGFFITINDKNTRAILSKAIIDDRESLRERDNYAFNLNDKIESSVNEEIERLRLILDADRVTISSFHDNLKTTTGLHFRFFSQNYEKVCYERGIPEIALNYQNVRTSLYEIVTYLSKRKLLIASREDMEFIDRRYAHAMMIEDTYRSGLYYMRSSSGIEIGILTVTWNKENKNLIPSDEKIKEKLIKAGTKLESLLDLDYYNKYKYFRD